MHRPFCGSYTESAVWSTVATTRSLAAGNRFGGFATGGGRRSRGLPTQNLAGLGDPMAPGTADSGLPNGHGGRTGGIPGVSISGSLVRALPVNRRPYPDRTGTVHHDPPIRGKSSRKDFL